jgi:hypothetical protein
MSFLPLFIVFHYLTKTKISSVELYAYIGNYAKDIILHLMSIN